MSSLVKRTRFFMHCRINSTLLHLRDVIDYYTIVDTASEDNTIEVVRELMSSVRGQIVQHGPLRSFADARNHAFKVRQAHQGCPVSAADQKLGCPIFCKMSIDHSRVACAGLAIKCSMRWRQ